jgi:pimeloyl-ACP methyl ester carboxylesterase
MPPKVKILCVPIPERVVDGATIPAAKLYVRLQGKKHHNKPSILFVHGTSASNVYWRCVQELFSKQYHTISLDLRGHGQSEQTPAGPAPSPAEPYPYPLPPPDIPPAGQINYNHRLFADDIAALLDYLKVDEVIWAGVSIGGSIGIQFNHQYPGVIKRLAMFSAGPGLYRVPPCPDGPPCQDLQPCNPCWPFFIPVGGTPDTLLPESAECPDEIAPVKLKIAQNQARAGPIIPNLLRYMWTEDLRPLLSDIKVPTLIGYGSIDPLQPDGGSSKYMHEYIDNSVLVKFVGKGHLMMITAYQAVYDVLAEFIVSDKMPDSTVVFNTGCECDVCPDVVVEEPFDACP